MRRVDDSQLIVAAIALIFAVAAFLMAGCASSPGSSSVPPPGVANSAPSVNSADSADPDQATRCKTFKGRFQLLVACQRANGTLGSFGNHQVTWRVRYFVRYMLMPCGDAPTVKEGYVFHMVINDLYGDGDLNDAQRLEVRNAMFDGKARC